MSNWNEIRAHLRAAFELARDEDGALAFTYRATVEGTEIVEGIGMSPTVVDGRPWLALVAELCSETNLSLRSAVQYQDRLPFGAIVLRNDLWLLRHGVLLEPLTLPDFEWTLRMVVQEAVRLRANLRRGLDAGDAFDFYAE